MKHEQFGLSPRPSDAVSKAASTGVAPEGPVAPEVIACISEGRTPTAEELARVANHIAQEVRMGPSAFAWGDADARRALSVKAARLALQGSD